MALGISGARSKNGVKTNFGLNFFNLANYTRSRSFCSSKRNISEIFYIRTDKISLNKFVSNFLSGTLLYYVSFHVHCALLKRGHPVFANAER